MSRLELIAVKMAPNLLTTPNILYLRAQNRRRVVCTAQLPLVPQLTNRRVV